MTPLKYRWTVPSKLPSFHNDFFFLYLFLFPPKYIGRLYPLWRGGGGRIFRNSIYTSAFNKKPGLKCYPLFPESSFWSQVFVSDIKRTVINTNFLLLKNYSTILLLRQKVVDNFFFHFYLVLHSFLQLIRNLMGFLMFFLQRHVFCVPLFLLEQIWSV